MTNRSRVYAVEVAVVNCRSLPGSESMFEVACGAANGM
jgi:hypothetical protein